MLHLEPVAKALRGELARSIARQAEGFGDRRAEQGIAERVQDQRRACSRRPDAPRGRRSSWATRPRIESRIGFERVAVAGEDHPGGERAGAFLAERVEALVDDHARIGLAGAGALDRFGDAAR